MPWRVRETSVAREQRRFERFGEGNVYGVIGGEIVPQFPDARQQQIMRVSVQRKGREVGESRTAPLSVDLPVRRVPTDDLCDLDIEQMRRVQCL